MGKGLPSPRKRVIFRPPAGMKKAKTRRGKIVSMTPFRLFSSDFGEYCVHTQRIAWDNGWKSVRIAYYRRNSSSDPWRFGSQTTVNGPLRTIKTICRDILKTTW